MSKPISVLMAVLLVACATPASIPPPAALPSPTVVPSQTPDAKGTEIAIAANIFATLTAAAPTITPTPTETPTPSPTPTDSPTPYRSATPYPTATPEPWTLFCDQVPSDMAALVFTNYMGEKEIVIMVGKNKYVANPGKDTAVPLPPGQGVINFTAPGWGKGWNWDYKYDLAASDCYHYWVYYH